MRPILEFYEVALCLIQLKFSSLYIIGIEMDILGEDDYTMSTTTMQREIFTYAIRHCRFNELKNRIIKAIKEENEFDKKFDYEKLWEGFYEADLITPESLK